MRIGIGNTRFHLRLRKYRDMTKETKIMILLDRRDESMEKLIAEYNYRSIGVKDILGLTMWKIEEEDKIEKEFIKGIMEL